MRHETHDASPTPFNADRMPVPFRTVPRANRASYAMGLVGLLVGASAATAQDRSQSRSMVVARMGIVASENVLASEVGARILENGGNAIDAAVATNAMMGLVAPMN